MSEHDRYSSPLAERYASQGDAGALVAARRDTACGAGSGSRSPRRSRSSASPIPDEAIAQMRAHLDDIDFAAVAAYERRFRHDVMAHVHAFGDVAPAAQPFIHLGATSAYVTDNADLILMREGSSCCAAAVVDVLRALAAFAARVARPSPRSATRTSSRRSSRRSASARRSGCRISCSTSRSSTTGSRRFPSAA